MRYFENQPLHATTIFVLEALRDHPFLTARQLSWHLKRNLYVIQHQLWMLQRKQWARRYPLYVPEMPTAQWVYALSANGVQALASHERLTLSVYQEKHRYSISRLRWLALVLDRVYHVRQILMHIESICPGWSVWDWDVETETRYETRMGKRRMTYHGSAILVNGQQHWLPLVIEWDSDLVPMKGERARWTHFVSAQGDPEFSYSADYQFPLLVFIAQDLERLNNFNAFILSIAKRVRSYMPRAYYLTHYARWRSDLEKPTSSAKIWYCTETEEWIAHPLVGCAGNHDEPRSFWQCRPYRQGWKSHKLEVEPLSATMLAKPTLDSITALSLAMRPLEKRLVNMVARYPLLTASELAIVLESAPSKVWDGLARLVRMRLLHAYSFRPQTSYAKSSRRVRAYLVLDLGVRYLAAASGFGNMPKRFVNARGWERNLEILVQHLTHTRIENKLFVQLLTHARAQGHLLTWYSEQEARLYLKTSETEWTGRFSHGRPRPRPKGRRSSKSSEAAEEMASEQELDTIDEYPTRKQFYTKLAEYGQQFQKYLPDGRGVYRIQDETWELAVEIDLSRANHLKIAAKLEYYDRFLFSHDDRINLRVLIVTHSWQRAQNLYWLVWKMAARNVWDGRLINANVELWQLREWERAGIKTMERLRATEKHTPQDLIQRVLPVYITTVDELERRGIEEPIWLRVQEGIDKDGKVQHTYTKTKCLEYIGD